MNSNHESSALNGVSIPTVIIRNNVRGMNRGRKNACTNENKISRWTVRSLVRLDLAEEERRDNNTEEMRVTPIWKANEPGRWTPPGHVENWRVSAVFHISAAPRLFRPWESELD